MATLRVYLANCWRFGEYSPRQYLCYLFFRRLSSVLCGLTGTYFREVQYLWCSYSINPSVPSILLTNCCSQLFVTLNQWCWLTMAKNADWFFLFFRSFHSCLHLVHCIGRVVCSSWPFLVKAFVWPNVFLLAGRPAFAIKHPSFRLVSSSALSSDALLFSMICSTTASNGSELPSAWRISIARKTAFAKASFDLAVAAARALGPPGGREVWIFVTVHTLGPLSLCRAKVFDASLSNAENEVSNEDTPRVERLTERLASFSACRRVCSWNMEICRH